MNILIGNAWPYANGPLHLGRIAVLLPGDILARYHRMMGDDVVFLSGTDCHGTPVTMRAQEEGITPIEAVEKYHSEFKRCFKALNFSFDIFEKTHSEYHQNKVKEFILDLYNKGFIYEETIEQDFCKECNEYLSDRYVVGKCPKCGNETFGDQCEECSEILDSNEILDKRCKTCNSQTILKETRHLFFSLSKFENDVRRIFIKQDGWRQNAQKIVKRYLDEGLRDRAVTRDCNWGVDIPLEGYDDKRIFVWIEAVMGYLTASMKCLDNREEDWMEYWQGEDSRVYFVHGKDNIPFHTVIFPAILVGLDIKNPNIRVISSEYLKLEGKQFSSVKNWALWVDYIAKNYNTDSFRYYMALNSPEDSDSDFTWKDYIYINNNDLVNTISRFVNKVTVFNKRVYGARVPKGKIDENLKRDILNLYFNIGDNIEIGAFKESLNLIISFCRKINKEFDDANLWELADKNPNKCKEKIYNYIQVVINLSNLLEPFIPSTCSIIRKNVGISEPMWSFIEKKEGIIKEIPMLFNRIDKRKAIDEVNRLKEKKL